MASWMDRATRAAEVLRRGRVLVVCPTAEHAGAIAKALTELDLVPVLAFDADGARRTADGVACNVAVIDVRVVDDSPLSLIRDVAEQVSAGVLVLGPCDEPADRLFDAGAFLLGSTDWSALHVAARVSTRLRVRPPVETRSTLAWGPLELDPAMHLAWWGGTPLAITPTEFKILVALVLAKGAVVSKSELQSQLWGTKTAVDDKRLEAHVRRLRGKLGDLHRTPFLLTVRGQGYRLIDRRVARRAVAVDRRSASRIVAV
ncbi:MAG TPA: response regulator transcription factor [Acidimicrobiales bacterium]|nr:response regulator transcription factor [Acidimicrobiales bacterium]